MTIKTMDDLFVKTLKDMSYAVNTMRQRQFLKAPPTMVNKASADELKDALEQHRQETEGQVERL